MARSIFLLLLIAGFLGCAHGNIPYITQPPKGWECINDPAQLPQKIKVIFIGPKSNKNSQFTPSMNVAYEVTQLSLLDYVAVAKSYHEKQGQTRCVNLGKIDTLSGPAELLQIDRPSQWGDIRFVQAMLVTNGEAYVVTATCLKNDFGALSTQIFKTIQSFSLYPVTQNQLLTK